MASILEKRKAQIREALVKANAAFKAQDYDDALKLLQPYHSDKKVQHAIKLIGNARKKNVAKVKEKPEAKPKQANNQLNFVFVILWTFLGLLVIAGILGQYEKAFPKTYYTSVNSAYLRTCTEGNCEILAILPVGEELTFLEPAEGAAISDSVLWYKVILRDGREGFIHSTVVSELRPTAAPIMNTPRPAQAPVQAPVQSNWNCSGNRYDCSSFRSCADVMSYFNSCPYDPSEMDGDGDGRPCEQMCGH